MWRKNEYLAGGNGCRLTNAGFIHLEQALTASGVDITRCDSGRRADELIGCNSYAAVAVDISLTDGDGLAFVQQCARKYPLVNFALASGLDAETFHETTEGLGIFMQIPVDADAADARQMLALLDKITGLMAG